MWIYLSSGVDTLTYDGYYAFHLLHLVKAIAMTITDTSLIPAVDAGGRLYPVIGDEFTINAGIVVQIMADADVDFVTADGSVLGTMSGEGFFLKGTDRPLVFRVTRADYPRR